eukprot:maker-scaffold624_size122968-snap-gene-0.16 protein:Tk09509 transcript:maker-scaffold624_size122968-snap-gene-0.16-mRNA-1 annotation:"hypothetical protein BRAFLDRAFT_123644"
MNRGGGAGGHQRPGGPGGDPQPVSNEQIVAIIRQMQQRADLREGGALPAPIMFPVPPRGGAQPPGSHAIALGVGPKNYPPYMQPGWAADSVGYNVGDGLLYKGRPRGQAYGPKCVVGDRVGCGIRSLNGQGNSPKVASIYFTLNGLEQEPAVTIPLPSGGRLYPMVGMQNPGEQVKILSLGTVILSPEEDIMLVDGGEEDEWLRLHDIRFSSGQLLEYIGRGKSLVDVGIAQARSPICTRNHYFEIEIVDPGSNCFIAIGLARQDYPKNRHPGWNKGSIAYHADDGKLFVGSGVGTHFGPRCYKGDIMGCGILFPRNYECKSDSEEEIEQQSGCQLSEPQARDLSARAVEPLDLADCANNLGGYIGDSPDDEDDDDQWNEHQVLANPGVEVEVYFTRNGSLIGRRSLKIPKGGFYPTIGMMSSNEKVRVDLHPLTG